MGIPDHLTCLLNNLYAGQETTVRTGHGTTDWFQIGKGVRQGCILSPWLFNLYAEYIMRNAGLEEAQIGTQIHVERVIKICFQTVMLEKTLESPLGSKEIKSINPKGNQAWIFIGRTYAEVKAPILWLPDVKSHLIGKDPNARKDWEQEEKWVTEDKSSWMASPPQWMWVWANSRRQWRTGKPGVLQSMGSKRVERDWATEQQQMRLYKR